MIALPPCGKVRNLMREVVFWAPVPRISLGFCNVLAPIFYRQDQEVSLGYNRYIHCNKYWGYSFLDIQGQYPFYIGYNQSIAILGISMATMSEFQVQLQWAPRSLAWAPLTALWPPRPCPCWPRWKPLRRWWTFEGSFHLKTMEKTINEPSVFQVFSMIFRIEVALLGKHTPFSNTPILSNGFHLV